MNTLGDLLDTPWSQVWYTVPSPPRYGPYFFVAGQPSTARRFSSKCKSPSHALYAHQFLCKKKSVYIYEYILGETPTTKEIDRTDDVIIGRRGTFFLATAATAAVFCVGKKK